MANCRQSCLLQPILPLYPSLSLKEVEYALYENKNFIRIHKSYIISKNHILSVYGNSIILSNNFEITIGSTFKETFSRFLNSNLLS
ncbi:LytTR family transcriptional regulator DNA-binding domain-containing protein [Pedobacter rhodius]|uniref:LytTR family transcriptional regulator DNA-binding domain-containing protein n=1 Tax=Pedobacter rhodius TaxID=3004098 RepID=UPI003D17061A